jgi:DNA (cytosine-5)-methyltransferase 1
VRRLTSGRGATRTSSVLVVEPLRWVVALNPEWVALEQVPAVLPLWEVVAEILRARGYGVWTGVLEAERYGVPQTRERAVLMARRGDVVHPPEPTHHRYVPNEPRPERVEGLFGTVEPWVSMAEALGWDLPVTVNTRGDRGDEPAGGNEFDASRPSWCLTEKARSWVGMVDTGNTRSGSRPEGRWRNADDPATTLTVRADQLEARRGDGSGVRLTTEEAAVLQTFPLGYPWQGTRSKAYQQIGNAVPPLLAAHVLAALLGREPPRPR